MIDHSDQDRGHQEKIHITIQNNYDFKAVD